MDSYGVSRAFMFCLDEPDRHPGFRARERPDARARGALGRAADPVRPARPRARTPIAEATRCLDLGARGIKLHPRAQRFLLNDERLAPVFALAAERKRADPHPRRSRPAADRRRARGASPTRTPTRS